MPNPSKNKRFYITLIIICFILLFLYPNYTICIYTVKNRCKNYFKKLLTLLYNNDIVYIYRRYKQMALIEKLEQAFDSQDWELVNEILDELDKED